MNSSHLNTTGYQFFLAAGQSLAWAKATRPGTGQAADPPRARACAGVTGGR